jgi:hypothetical protein
VNASSDFETSITEVIQMSEPVSTTHPDNLMYGPTHAGDEPTQAEVDAWVDQHCRQEYLDTLEEVAHAAA